MPVFAHHNRHMEKLKQILFNAEDAIDQIRVILGEEEIEIPYENDLGLAYATILKLRGYVDCLSAENS